MKEFLQGRWLGHPLHPILVHLPTALWITALLFDVLSRVGAGGNTMVQISFYTLLVGFATALLAILAGVADWWDIGQDKPAWKLGLYHMILNLTATVLTGINLVLRLPQLDAPAVGLLPLGLSAAVTLILLVSGYLGGRMVFAYGTSIARNSKEKWRRHAEAGRANVPPRKGGS